MRAYIITTGAFNGQRGVFTRNVDGAVVGVDLAGRLFRRLSSSPSEAAVKTRISTGSASQG